MVLKVWADRGHYSPEHRQQLVDILKAHWNERGPEERRQVYGALPDLFTIVDAPEAADLHLLTLSWNHYFDRGEVGLVAKAVETAQRCQRPIAIFSAGDFTAHVPFPYAHVFEHSSYRSRSRGRVHALPSFFPDLAAQYYDGQPPAHDKPARALVGFCGQAGAGFARTTVRKLRNLARRAAYRAGRRRWEPTPMEHTALRQRIVDTFATSRDIDTLFVLRRQYRAGLPSGLANEDPQAKAKLEFVHNLADADYTLCARGGGNYSKRFFESLCLGRVPLLIDTDTLLPYHDQIDWSSYLFRVELAELASAPRRLAEHHARLTPAAFVANQHACRKLWLDRLTRDGFYGHFHQHFEGRASA